MTISKIDDVAKFWLIKNLHNELFGEDLFDDLPQAFIAGGCFNSLLGGRPIKDIDIFSPTPEKVIKHLSEIGLKIQRENDFICNFKHKKFIIQVIKKFIYTDARAVIDSFDYTIVCAAYDGKDLVVNERFFIDNAQRRLVVNSLPKPLSTLRRLAKYSSRGYTACPVGLGKLARAINELTIDWENPQENEIDFYPDGTPTFRGLD